MSLDLIEVKHDFNGNYPGKKGAEMLTSTAVNAIEQACQTLATYCQHALPHGHLDRALAANRELPLQAADIQRQLESISRDIFYSIGCADQKELDAKLDHLSAFEVRLADAVIKTFNLCANMGIDLPAAVTQMIIYNTMIDAGPSDTSNASNDEKSK